MKTKILLLILFLGTLVSCKVGRFVYYNFADITDYKIFPERKIEKSDTPFYFAHKSNTKFISSITITVKKKQKDIAFEDFLKNNKTVAFLVIKNDSIVYENYFYNYKEDTPVNSFSMAKSILSVLIGCAIDDGYIKSTDEPITNYLPELAKNGFDKVKIKNLLNMTSGIGFNESYFNPFGNAASFYYGRNLKKEVSKLKLKNNPGQKFHYSSGDSQVLGLVLQAALKEKSISLYAQEKLWKPLGMQYDAAWSLDKTNGTEKTFCCLNSVALDFAKIGRLYLNNGNWNGKQIVASDWVDKCTKPKYNESGVWFYQNQWWINNKQLGSYRAEGINGEYVYVYPKNKVIIVRLGKRYGKNDIWDSLFDQIAVKL